MNCKSATHAQALLTFIGASNHLHSNACGHRLRSSLTASAAAGTCFWTTGVHHAVSMPPLLLLVLLLLLLDAMFLVSFTVTGETTLSLSIVLSPLLLPLLLPRTVTSTTVLDPAVTAYRNQYLPPLGCGQMGSTLMGPLQKEICLTDWGKRYAKVS